ncbi:MAG TPA: DUF3617 family protein [Xanthobacteraceae bacterium]|jgi:hypothetical protein|nr:DUF3617 family protein [Xanthobacteraceae bacterium]
MYEFAEYSNYDGLWLAELARNRKVKPFLRIGDERITSSEEVMARICTVFFFLVFATSASAAELPARKAGLGEITSSASGRSMKMQQCIDASTDQAMQGHGGAAAGNDCSKRDVQKSGSTMTVDSVCTVAGKAVTSHIVVNGSFDSEYTMNITSQGAARGGQSGVTLTARWLGPCAADQKPGDMIMPNGTRMNILNMPKARGQPGTAGAPADR